MLESTFLSLPHSVQVDIREYFNENRLGDSWDKWLDTLDLTSALNSYLNWNGIIGYTAIIMEIVDVLRPDPDLEDLEVDENAGYEVHERTNRYELALSWLALGSKKFVDRVNEPEWAKDAHHIEVRAVAKHLRSAEISKTLDVFQFHAFSVKEANERINQLVYLDPWADDANYVAIYFNTIGSEG